jgi:hypothetical protein
MRKASSSNSTSVGRGMAWCSDGLVTPLTSPARALCRMRLEIAAFGILLAVMLLEPWFFMVGRRAVLGFIVESEKCVSKPTTLGLMSDDSILTLAWHSDVHFMLESGRGSTWSSVLLSGDYGYGPKMVPLAWHTFCRKRSANAHHSQHPKPRK